MNQPRTIYQTDFTPLDWLQNNLISNMNEFCSPDNIDDCLKYISQEFSALGYPSIYSNSSDCPAAANCDIVKFLNASFELLRRHNEHTQTKEDLEDKNQRLSTDLNVITKKNSQLKNALEQNERRFASTLERERQLKEKNDQLSQLLKAEKEETKKLATQMRQQKVAHQHEIRKYENNMEHIKTKLNQLLSDKNPSKKLTNISKSHPLPRNPGQRGKWKTDLSATSAIEDMYASVISSYENRCKEMCKELNFFRHCLQSTILQIIGIVCNLKEGIDGNDSISASDDFVFNEMKSEARKVEVFEERVKYLLSVLKEAISRKESQSQRNLENQITLLKKKMAESEKSENICGESHMIEEFQEHPKCTDKDTDLETLKAVKLIVSEVLKKEKLKIDQERQEFLKSLEKEKAQISYQKLSFLKLAMQQKVSPSSWHHSLNSLPSISVITSRNGAPRISSASQLDSFSCIPDQMEQDAYPSPPELLPKQSSTEKHSQSKSDSVLIFENRPVAQSSWSSPVTPDLNFSSSDLPSWASKKTGAETVVNEVSKTLPTNSQDILNEDLRLSDSSVSDEISLDVIKAAIQSIEQKKASML